PHPGTPPCPGTPPGTAVTAVITHAPPTIRPDDLAAALDSLVSGRLGPPQSTHRQAQGRWTGTHLTNPLA
ncbi:MAG: hypothetical protein FWD59_05505, partial [Micrococcales bacterium]|nr:hypothetical protein [Micrococcales bacterium]